MLLQTSDKVKSVHSAYWLCYIPLYMNHIFISFAVISYIVLQEHIEHKGLKTFTVYIKFHATIWLDDEKMWKMMWNSSSKELEQTVDSPILILMGEGSHITRRLSLFYGRVIYSGQ